MNRYPLISCICVTRGKPEMLSRAMSSFEAQTYPEKELVLLCEDDDDITLAWLKEQKKCRYYHLILVPGTPKQNLGRLRNRAIKEAAGEYICQWDDDDWYHADRLTLQYETLSHRGYAACVLGRWLLYDTQQQAAYVSHRRTWEGSLLCKRVLVMQQSYPDVAKGEETPFIEYLGRNRLLYVLDTAPQLYIYNWHGGNTWHRQHWEMLFRHGQRLTAEQDTLIQDIMQQHYSVPEASVLLNHLLQNK